MTKRRKKKLTSKSCEHQFHLVKIFPQYNCMNDSLSIIAPNYHAIFVCQDCWYLLKKKIKHHEDDEDEDY